MKSRKFRYFDFSKTSPQPQQEIIIQSPLNFSCSTRATRAGGVTEQTRFGELGAIYAPNENTDLALCFIREKNRDTGTVTNTATVGVTWRFK